MKNEKKIHIVKKSGIYIIISVILLSFAVTFVDAFIKPDYVLKVIAKIISFLLIPSVYYFLNRNESGNFKKLFKFQKKTMGMAILIGIGIYGVIVGGYFITRNFADYSNVVGTLQNNHGITADNFIFCSLYVSLLNSFLEEFFFRGFGFISLKPHIGRRGAYIFSSAMFAIYHAGMMIGMFGFGMLVLMFAGLFIGGCIFNFLNEKSESIYTSWASHMFANFAINTVGFILLGVI